MTPRLAVTQEQAKQLYVVDRGQASRSWRLRSSPVTLRFHERPTMPCEESCDRGDRCPVSAPIPEGTEVVVEYPCPGCTDCRWSLWPWEYENPPCNDEFLPVATAILTSVSGPYFYDPADEEFYEITLSNIKPLEDS